MGNSMVDGKKVKDFPTQSFRKSIPIAIERLDDLIDVTQLQSPGNQAASSREDFQLSQIKMDAQGFECFIMDGMPQVLSRSHLVKAELAEKWLTSFNCSSAIFVNKLRQAQMEVYQNNRKIMGDPVQTRLAEIVARRPP